MSPEAQRISARVIRETGVQITAFVSVSVCISVTFRFAGF